ncbi:MAG: GNAT family N-acetyltransferase [Sutterellaceae bacterium]|nr:GNAT family N-acetyltransferase [Sutterellaceae bacterium]MDD7442707.1 GNAT family N-acetyltransferase [Sutterellaceae bacterium]MDY2868509.1 GNAT family N-acetyltransferase [Mesosutterella sp.]
MAEKLTGTITLGLLEPADRERFIRENQEAFRYGAMEEFGLRDSHVEEDGKVISRRTIERSIDAPGAEALRILEGGKPVGGVVLKLGPGERRGELVLLFVTPNAHSRGIGQAAWKLVERRHPEVRLWETFTPYFERRNIHFYVNKCGFRAVEFFCEKHPLPRGKLEEDGGDDFIGDGMFRFEKRIVSPG